MTVKRSEYYIISLNVCGLCNIVGKIMFFEGEVEVRHLDHFPRCHCCYNYFQARYRTRRISYLVESRTR